MVSFTLLVYIFVSSWKQYTAWKTEANTRLAQVTVVRHESSPPVALSYPVVSTNPKDHLLQLLDQGTDIFHAIGGDGHFFLNLLGAAGMRQRANKITQWTATVHSMLSRNINA